jgi:tripartite-type tricarboxylate transporter receptor subunit TctC
MDQSRQDRGHQGGLTSPGVLGRLDGKAASCFLLLAALGMSLAQAQPYPSKPVRLVVGFPAGGPADVAARIVAQPLGDRLGRPVVVENRPGATGTIAAGQVAKSAPDGYTAMMATQSTNATVPYMYSRISYDTVKDFAAVVGVGQSPLLLAVHPSLPVKSVKELIVLARAKPGQVTFGTGGIGSTPHMSMELFKAMAQVDILPVHYKGESPAITETMGGHVQVVAASIAVLLPHVQAGKLRGLAVSTARRAALAPDFPTVGESGLKGYETTSWQGIVVPAGTPRAIIQKLNADTVQVLSQPSVRDQFLKLGIETVGDTPEQFGEFLGSENARWGKLIKELGLKAE